MQSEIMAAGFRDYEIQYVNEGIPAHEPKYYFEVERELMEQFWTIKKDEVVVDVGAAFGSWSIPALKADARVYAYEPHPVLYSLLKRNVALNDLTDKFHAMNLPLWSSRVTLTLPVYDLSMMINERSKTQPALMVSTKTLDDDLADIDRLDWIKIDTEGAEIEILKGAQTLIKKFNPYIIVEWHADRNKDPEMKYLKDNYESIQQIDAGHYLVQMHK